MALLNSVLISCKNACSHSFILLFNVFLYASLLSTAIHGYPASSKKWGGQKHAFVNTNHTHTTQNIYV